MMLAHQLGIPTSCQNEAVQSGFRLKQTSYEKSQNLQSEEFDLCAPHSPSTEHQCHSKSPKRGPTHLRLPETRLPLRIGSMPSWRLLARLDSVAGCHQKRICVLLRPRVLDLSLIRNLSCMRCFRVVVSQCSECAKNLSGHDRFEINVERDPYPVMWAPRY